MGTVAVSLVRAVADELAHQGVDPSTLLIESGIDPTLLDDASSRVDLALYDRFQSLALVRTGDDAFGLHMGEHGSLAAFSTLGHMVAQCRTIREAIDQPWRWSTCSSIQVSSDCIPSLPSSVPSSTPGA